MRQLFSVNTDPDFPEFVIVDHEEKKRSFILTFQDISEIKEDPNVLGEFDLSVEISDLEVAPLRSKFSVNEAFAICQRKVLRAKRILNHLGVS